MLAAQEPGRFASGILAVLVHVLFFGLLVIGISWQKKAEGPVMVDLWQELPPPLRRLESPVPDQPKPAPPPKPAPVEKKVPPPPLPPKVEAPPKPTPAEIELREKQQRQKEEQERQVEEQNRLEAEKRRIEEEQKRLDQEKLRREEETRRAEEQKRAEEMRRAEDLRREEERRERAIAMERERVQQEAARKQREADESRRRADAAARAAQQKLVDDWRARIQAKIKGRVVVPPNIDGNPEARFEVVLLPGGEVLSATLKKSSGVAAYDAAVERAIMVAQPLPVPAETDLFQENFRELALVFRPRD